MQSAMPEALNLSDESDSTFSLYGMQRDQTEGLGWQCSVWWLVDLSNAGCDLFELIHTGSSGNWDSHGNMADHGRLAPQVDHRLQD